MKPGQVYDEPEIGGKKIVIRAPEKADAEPWMEFVNAIVDQRAMIGKTKKVTLEEEKGFVADRLKKMARKDEVCLVAEHGGEIVASTNIEKKKPEAVEHVGSYGIAVSGGWRRKGLGNLMTEMILDLAKDIGIETVVLSVYEKNKPAERMYRKLGFKKWGTLKRGAKFHGEYLDEMHMVKYLDEEDDEKETQKETQKEA